MFVSEAHSVTLQARLAITLAWIAGYTNAVTLLTCHTATSHMSGTTSTLGIALVEQNWGLLLLCLLLLGAFVFGAALSAAATEFAKIWNHQSIYVGPMILQAGALAAFALCVEFIPAEQLVHSGWLYVALGSAATAMGVQNSTITSISRGVVRTTHVTGVLTDLGHEAMLLLVRKFSAAARLANVLEEGREISLYRLVLLGSIVGSFAVGAALGTAGYEIFPRYSMFPPVLFLLWIVLQDIVRPIASITPATISKESGISLPASCAYFAITPRVQRSKERQRVPNLVLLVARQPSTVTTVLVDLTALSPLEHSVQRELKLVARKLKRSGKELRFIDPTVSPRTSSDKQNEGPFFANLTDAVWS